MAGRAGYTSAPTNGDAAPAASDTPAPVAGETGGWAKATGERRDLNQYWFSDQTISKYVAEIEHHSKKGAAFLSTPSIYFSLRNTELRKKSKVFEFDRQWESDPGFVFYDFNKPDQIPISLFGAFDYVVIDPPFITDACWRCYAETARILLADGGKILGTSIAENTPMLKTIAGLSPVAFRPSIPNLVYQYETFTSYSPTEHLAEPNPEVPAAGSASDVLARAERESYDDFAKGIQSRDRSGEAQLPSALAQKNSWDRVPEGLTEYPEGQDGPGAPKEPTEHGAAYARAAALRERVGECRRLIDSGCKPLDRLWKTAVTMRKADKAGDAAKRAQAETDREAATAELSRIIGELEMQKQALCDPPTPRGAEIAEVLSAAMEKMNLKEVTKQQYQDLLPTVQQYFLAPLFNHQKALLAEMKAAKKQTPAAP